MIGNLIRIVFFFFILYFLIYVIKYIIKMIATQSKDEKKTENYQYYNTQSKNNKVIELDKDDYKIE